MGAVHGIVKISYKGEQMEVSGCDAFQWEVPRERLYRKILCFFHLLKDIPGASAKVALQQDERRNNPPMMDKKAVRGAPSSWPVCLAGVRK